MVEEHGQDSQKVMRLHCADIGIGFPMAGRRWKVSYSTSVIAVCGQKEIATNTLFNCVRSVKCGKETVQWVLVKHHLIIFHWRQPESPKEMAAMYNFRRGIRWASSCLILRIKIITFLQMRWVQTISSLPYCRIVILQFLTINVCFRLLQTNKLYIFHFQNEQKHSTLTLSNK